MFDVVLSCGCVFVLLVVVAAVETRIGVNGTFEIVIGGFGDICGLVAAVVDVMIELVEFVVTIEISSVLWFVFINVVEILDDERGVGEDDVDVDMFSVSLSPPLMNETLKAT